MPSILQSSHSISGLAAGATSTWLHGLCDSAGNGYTPNRIMPTSATPIVVVSATSTQVTVRNDGSVAASALFVCQYDHSIQQAALTPPVNHWWAGTGAAGGDIFNTANVWIKQQGSELYTLDGSGAVTAIDAQASSWFYLNMVGDTQLGNPINMAPIQVLNIIVEADGVHELTYDTYWDWGTGVTPDISAMADGKWLILTGVVRSTTEIGLGASEIFG